MIRVAVMYPGGADTTFDMAYYKASHMPMVREALGEALLKEEIWTGVASAPDQPAAFQLVLHMYFENQDAFGAAFGAHAGSIMADVANYTNTQPVFQVETPA